jgi:ABC-2 type transport system permease protein
MNTEIKVMSTTITTMGIIKTQFKRELWENKTGFLYAPLMVSGLVIALMFVGVFYAQKFININGGDSTQHGEQDTKTSKHDSKKSFSFNFGNGKPTEIKDFNLSTATKDNPGFFGAPISAAIAINGILIAVVFFITLIIYANSCLFDDRKNRDILFWRSMPVSEHINVLVKLGVIVCIAPVVILLLSITMGLIAFFLSIIFFMANGVALSVIFTSIAASDAVTIAFKMSFVCFVALFVLMPAFSFNLFCSSLAKKSPVFTGAFIPVVLIVLDKLAQVLMGFNLHVIDAFANYGKALKNIFVAIMENKYAMLDANTALVYGVSLVMAVLFLSATIWLRNNRYEI